MSRPTDLLRRCREQFGISYIVVIEANMEKLAPVVALLTGEEATPCAPGLVAIDSAIPLRSRNYSLARVTIWTGLMNRNASSRSVVAVTIYTTAMALIDCAGRMPAEKAA